MIPIPTTDLSVDEIRLGVPETWLRSDREGMFARLRAERPVGFQAEAEVPGFLRGPGYWAITRHADVQQVSRDAETFVSGQGSNIPDLPVEMNEFFGSMINMDAPKHTKLRSKFVFVFIAISKFQIKNSSYRIAIICRKSTCKKVAIA